MIRAVGALDRLHADHVAFPHGDRLADLPFDRLFEDSPAEDDVLGVLRGVPGHPTLERELIRDVPGRIDQFDSTAGEFVGKRPKQHGRALVVSGSTIPDVDGAPVGDVSKQSPRVVQLHLLDRSGKDCLLHAVSLADLDPTTDLQDARNLEVIAEPGEFR